MTPVTTVNAPATGISHFPLLKESQALGDRAWFSVSDLPTKMTAKHKRTVIGQLLDLTGAGLLERRPQSRSAQYRVTANGSGIKDEGDLESWFWYVRGHNPNGFAAIARNRSASTTWQRIIYNQPSRAFLFAPGATYGEEKLLAFKRADTRLWFKDLSGRTLTRKFFKPAGENYEVLSFDKSTQIKATDYRLVGQEALMQEGSKLTTRRAIVAQAIIKACDDQVGSPTANLVYTLSSKEVASLLDETQAMPPSDIWDYITHWESTIV